MEQLGKSCSMLERQAEAAARHVESRFKCAYISEHVGGEFDGVITGVTHFGLFVMLNEFFVEGLVHVTNLANDYYHAEHGGLRLTGEHSGHSFGLGDTVRVKVTKVDVEEARVDLQIVGAQSMPSGAGKKSGKKAGKKTAKKVGKKSAQKAGQKKTSAKSKSKPRRRKR
jgi:ribonuclease R